MGVPRLRSPGVLALLLLHASLVHGAADGAAVTCPTLPADDAAIRLLLTAATYNESKTQTLAFNGTKWGPTLRLSLGQLYQIDVTNADIAGGTSVHWHGQHVANASWADGAQGLTQGAIPPGGTFSYRFAAGPAGTHWYHSHTHGQFGDGLRGALIVSGPADPSAQLYDADEHLLLLADVFSTPVAAQLAAQRRGGAGMAMCPGLDVSDAPWFAAEVNGESFATTGKAAVLTVRTGKRYRFRAVGGMSSWAVAVAVQRHNVTLIAVDGQPVQPAPAAALVLNSGERADFVLAADQPVGNYWINVTTLDGHNSPAILHYEGAPDPAADPAVSAGAYDAELGCLGSSLWGFEQTAALRAGPGVPPPPQESDRQLTLFLSFGGASAAPASFAQSAAQPDNPYGLPAAAAAAAALPANGSGCPAGNGSYCWSLNWNVFAMPPSLPIYAAAGSAPGNGGDASQAGQPASYSIALQQGEVVDLAMVNTGGMVHPMHLHGAAFWVLATGHGDVLTPGGALNATAAALNLRDPPLRDTAPVPPARMAPTMAGRVADGTGDGDIGSMGGEHDMHGMHGMDTSASEAGTVAAAEGGTDASAEGAATGHEGHDMGGGMASAAEASGSGHEGHGTGGSGMAGGAGMGHQHGTVASPDAQGYAVVRFVADNPGVWAFHCHIDLHSASGMMLYFVVEPQPAPANSSGGGGSSGGWYAPEGLECGGSHHVHAAAT